MIVFLFYFIMCKILLLRLYGLCWEENLYKDLGEFLLRKFVYGFDLFMFIFFVFLGMIVVFM